MLSLDARFTLLLLFCSLSTQWLPLTAVNAAAITQRPYQARRSSIRPADFDVTSKKQKVLPWSAGQHQRDLERVKRLDNPFANFMHTVFSGVKNKMHHHTRSPTQSIIIPSRHGDTYAVHHSRREAPLWRVGQAGARRSLRKRSIDSGTLGTISIQSGNESLASLHVEEDNINIIASNKNPTLFQIVDAGTPSTSRGDFIVYLVAQPASSNSPQIFYCATYNASPPKPEAMKMKQCVNATNAYTRPDNSSQIFTLNRDSGEIHPTLPPNAAQNNGANAQDVSTGPDAGSSASSSASLSASGSTSASVTGARTAVSPSQSASLSSRQNQSNAKNVTLVFIPQKAGSQSVVVEDEDTSGSSTSSGTASSTVSQGSTSTSATPPASSFTSVSSTDSSSAFRLATVSVSSSTSSSVSASASPSQSAGQSYGGLSVELVGDDNSLSSPSQSSTSSTSSTLTSSPTPSSTSSVPANARLPVSKLDPQAVASSIAAARASSTSLASASSTSMSSASSSASASASETLSAADVSPATSTSVSTSASATASASGSQTSPSPSSSSGDNIQTSAKFAAAVMKRAVSTEPYQWQFKAESR